MCHLLRGLAGPDGDACAASVCPQRLLQACVSRYDVALSFSFSGGVLFGDILNPTGLPYVRKQTLALHMQMAAHPVLPA